MILYALYVDAIFFPCHPYIWSTTVLHDTVVKFEREYKPANIGEMDEAGAVQSSKWQAHELLSKAVAKCRYTGASGYGINR